MSAAKDSLMRRFVIDTDTASDDAVALVMALRYPDVQVEAITLVAGNVPVDQGVQNALYTLELCGSRVPVYRGAERPLVRPLDTAQFVHGQDGMGDLGLPLSGRQPAPGHGVDRLVEVINRFAGEITLVTLGPLTNVALALRQDPALAHKVSRCCTMGGVGDGHGNVTPVSEYNIWADPDAAQIVFSSGMPITMVGWDISYKHAVFDEADARAFKGIGTPLAAFCIDIQGTVNQFSMAETKLAGFDLPDPITMAVALDPATALRTERLYVEVETRDGLVRGQTIVDHAGLTGLPPNIDVVLEASRARFLEILTAAVQP
jgi:purine nucleosidase